MFAFTCTSASVAEALQTSKSKLGSCVYSGASEVYSPDRECFANYRTINRDITTADRQMLKAVGMEDLEITLPNGASQTKMTFKDSIHAPQMVFTLISISKLDQAKYKVLFHNHFCTIFDPNGKTITRIPHLKGLYWIENKEKAENNSYAGAP